MSKRKQTDSTTPPQTVRTTRRRYLSRSMSDIQTEIAQQSSVPQTQSEAPSPSGSIEDIPRQEGSNEHEFPQIYSMQYAQHPQFNPQFNPGVTVDLSQSVMSLLNNPAFAGTLVSMMVPMLAPVLTASITASVTESLKDTIKSDISATVNDAVASALQPLTLQVSELSGRVDNNEWNIGSMQEAQDEATERVEQLEVGLEELEQYGRRNSLRFHNVELSDTDNCDDVIVKLCEEKLEVKIETDDISRSHPVGRPNRNDRRQLICRFKNWKVKNSVFSQKSKLKGNEDNIFITEDLTSCRQAIVNEMTKAKRAGAIHSHWSNDGRLFLKVTSEGPKHIVRSIDDLHNLAPPMF